MIQNVWDWLGEVKTLAVRCRQFGDTGKGKFVDYFAEWADIIARGTGGANAGHTIRVGDFEFAFHLLPSGMLHDKVVNIIGTGVAVEPGTVLAEMAALARANMLHDNLRISLNARLVLPQHVALDRVGEAAARKKGNAIGTTGRGMGPVFTDHVARVGLVMNDLLNPDVFVRKLRRNLEPKIRLLGTYDPEVVWEVMSQEILEGGAFYRSDEIFDVDAIAERYLEYGKTLRPLIADTDAMMQAAVGRKHILLEGAQGDLLSVDYGMPPYVTSSDCTLRGLTKGVGLHAGDVDVDLGIVKFPYMTRVGNGDFPTEFGGKASAAHCSISTRELEAEQYPDASPNDLNEFVQGVAIRQIGNEYGATTKRPRRTGRLDLPLLRYACSIDNAPNVILTKPDVMDGADPIEICTAYEYQGPDYVRGERMLRAGDQILTAIPDSAVMEHCVPRYVQLPGWKSSIRGIRNWEDFPDNFIDAVRFVETRTGVNVTLISVGPDREETVFMKPPIGRL
jgi:adenylosuccinate synthase